jgi:hypothetical protein
MAATGRLFHHSHTINDATQQWRPILGSGHHSKGKGLRSSTLIEVIA